MSRLAEIDEKDKEMLRCTWKLMNPNIQKIALNIFEMIFQQSPEAKKLFPFTDITKKNNDYIRFHSMRFMQAIHSAVDALDDLKKLDPLLANLGHVHGKLEETRDFKAEYWTVFRDCTLFHFRRALTKSSASGKTRKALLDTQLLLSDLDYTIVLWRMLLDYIIDGMTLSYQKEVRAREVTRKQLEQQSGDITDRIALLKQKRTERVNIMTEQRREQRSWLSSIFRCFCPK